MSEIVVGEREEAALTTVRHYMWWSAGAGLVPVPILDLVAVSGVQLKMLAEISKIYGVPFEANRGKAIISSLIGYVLPSALSFGLLGSVIKAVPGVGVLAGAPAMAVFSAAYAWAIGRVFIQHFESGGTFLNFDPEAVREHFRQEFEEGRKQAATIRTPGKKAENPA